MTNPDVVSEDFSPKKHLSEKDEDYE